MVQFVNIYIFFYFFNFCWVFQKFPFFVCHSVLAMHGHTNVMVYTYMSNNVGLYTVLLCVYDIVH